MSERWIKLHYELFTDPKLIVRPEWERWLWVVLLLMADEAGVVMYATPDALRRVAQLDRTPELVEDALVYFEARGMIRRGHRDTDEKDSLQIVNWSKRQGPSPESRRRMDRRNRAAGPDEPADSPPDRAPLEREREREKDHKETGGEPGSPPESDIHPGCEFCTYVSGAFQDLSHPHRLHDAWMTAFPKVDLLGQAKAARAWELANPTQKKHNHAKFLQNWFRKEQDRGPGPTYPPRKTEFASRAPEEGSGEWEKRKEEAREQAKARAEATRREMDVKLAVPVTTAEERKAILSKIKALPGKLGNGEEKK